MAPGEVAPPSGRSIPIVDLSDLQHDRAKFFREMEFALCRVGFMLLRAPGFEADFQQRCFDISHAFFDLSVEQKEPYSVVHSPHFRGWAVGGGISKHILQAFQMGVDERPWHDTFDHSRPLHERIQHGPNVWPDEALVPGFRAQLEELHARYLKLSRQLGHLICELLRVDPAVYDGYFDPKTPSVLAAVNRYTPAARVADADARMQIQESFADNSMGGAGMGAHRDGAPFVTLLIGDRPGLQVLDPHDNLTWIDVPVVPGTVVVNIGTTLMKLSGGRMISTTHRVNPTLAMDGNRVSLPYFLLPHLEGDLVPFHEPQSRVGPRASEARAGRDRALAYAVDRCALFRDAADRWYREDFAAAREAFKAETLRRKGAVQTKKSLTTAASRL